MLNFNLSFVVNPMKCIRLLGDLTKTFDTVYLSHIWQQNKFYENLNGVEKNLL